MHPLGEVRVIDGEPNPPRGGLSPSLATFTAGTCLAITSVLMSFDYGFNADQQAHRKDPGQQKQPEVVDPKTIVHSGPFRVQNFPHEVYFLDDGFTFSFGLATFRLDCLVAGSSEYSTPCIQSLIGTNGITHIDCTNGLTMHSDMGIIHIDTESFAKILSDANTYGNAGVTLVSNIPYTLEVKGMMHYMLPSQGPMCLPREGVCAAVLRRQESRSDMMASMKINK